MLPAARASVLSHQAFVLCVINSGSYSFNLSYSSLASMEAHRALADLPKTDVQHYLKLIGATDETEDISTVDDNAQEEAAYSLDQDQAPTKKLNDDVDDPEIEGNITPTPLGLCWSGRSHIPNKHYEGWWNYEVHEDVNDVNSMDDVDTCSHGSEYDDGDISISLRAKMPILGNFHI
ncbi:hypothetical protein BS47DRAFT_1378639 [Hydnum rufescens UP504]|uniref:Uncharacterized protein n=1 Tax=Hydnum rufescens UP504 TaxID=1448309 RepID=A0A9P6BAM4_9AGAM|nr:hypothetical protein BS47DRAFT_1378639 [Hydnum rufescens UP504]